jgi:hypothetical protein
MAPALTQSPVGVGGSSANPWDDQQDKTGSGPTGAGLGLERALAKADQLGLRASAAPHPAVPPPEASAELARVLKLVGAYGEAHRAKCEAEVELSRRINEDAARDLAHAPTAYERAQTVAKCTDTLRTLLDGKEQIIRQFKQQHTVSAWLPIEGAGRGAFQELLTTAARDGQLLSVESENLTRWSRAAPLDPGAWTEKTQPLQTALAGCIRMATAIEDTRQRLANKHPVKFS